MEGEGEGSDGDQTSTGSREGRRAEGLSARCEYWRRADALYRKAAAYHKFTLNTSRNKACLHTIAPLRTTAYCSVPNTAFDSCPPLHK